CETRSRRHASIAGQYPGDMSAMPVSVSCIEFGREVLAINNARTDFSRSRIQVFAGLNTAVDQRDADSGSGPAILSGNTGIDGGVCGIQFRSYRAIRGNV